jgi:hypothetical protein
LWDLPCFGPDWTHEFFAPAQTQAFPGLEQGFNRVNGNGVHRLMREDSTPLALCPMLIGGRSVRWKTRCCRILPDDGCLESVANA